MTTTSGFIFLADLGDDWTVTHPEALRRLQEQAPEGAVWAGAGTTGAWWEMP